MVRLTLVHITTICSLLLRVVRVVCVVRVVVRVARAVVPVVVQQRYSPTPMQSPIHPYDGQYHHPPVATTTHCVPLVHVPAHPRAPSQSCLVTPSAEWDEADRTQTKRTTVPGARSMHTAVLENAS